MKKGISLDNNNNQNTNGEGCCSLGFEKNISFFLMIDKISHNNS